MGLGGVPHSWLEVIERAQEETVVVNGGSVQR